MRQGIRSSGVVIVLVLTLAGPLWADAKSRAASEAAEYILQRFGRTAAREGTEALARKIESYSARYGDDFIKAARQVGPRAFRLVEEAGPHSDQVVRLLARHGEAAATWVVARPKGMALFLKHGDECASVLCKHPGLAEPVVERFGAPAVIAFKAVGSQGARRLTMLTEDGALARIGRTDEVLGVVGRYGDVALSFIWNHKAELAVSAALVAFLADPEPFLNGTRDLAAVIGENAVKPMIETTGKVTEAALVQAAPEIARRTNWTLIFLVVIACPLALVAYWLWRFGPLLRRWTAHASPGANLNSTERSQPCTR